MSADDKGFLIALLVLYLVYSWFTFGNYWVILHRRLKKQNEAARRIYLKPPNETVDFVALWICAPITTVFWPFFLAGKLVSIWWKSRR